MLVELPPFPPPQHRIYLDVIYGSAAAASYVQTRLMCERARCSSAAAVQTHGKVKVPLQVAEGARLGARRHRDGDARARLGRQRARARRVEHNTEALELSSSVGCSASSQRHMRSAPLSLKRENECVTDVRMVVPTGSTGASGSSSRLAPVL
jgi:hypothetical protein